VISKLCIAVNQSKADHSDAGIRASTITGCFAYGGDGVGFNFGTDAQSPALYTRLPSGSVTLPDSSTWPVPTAVQVPLEVRDSEDPYTFVSRKRLALFIEEFLLFATYKLNDLIIAVVMWIVSSPFACCGTIVIIMFIAFCTQAVCITMDPKTKDNGGTTIIINGTAAPTYVPQMAINPATQQIPMQQIPMQQVPMQQIPMQQVPVQPYMAPVTPVQMQNSV